jgi:phosphoglycerate dehydrogenase-like enzyme
MESKPIIGILISPQALSKLFSEEDLKKLMEFGHCRFAETDAPMDEVAAVDLLRDATVGVGSWNTPGPSAAIIKGCPKLRLWEHVAGSVKRFFGPHLNDSPLTIASCAPAIADSVAEMVVGQIIIGLRRLLQYDAYLKNGQDTSGIEKINLFSAQIGIVGASQVGRRVAALLQPFGCKVSIYDPFLSSEEASRMGVTLDPDLVRLFAQCHAVTLHTPKLPSTCRLIRSEHFAAMADHSIFINSSRGECVDQPAMIDALKSRPLTAFIDVIDRSEGSRSEEMLTLPNCFRTPHIAGGPNHRMGSQAVSDIKNFLSGGKPLMAVSANDLDRLA